MTSTFLSAFLFHAAMNLLKHKQKLSIIIKQKNHSQTSTSTLTKSSTLISQASQCKTTKDGKKLARLKKLEFQVQKLCKCESGKNRY